jgi:hypothetical protein
MPIKNSLSAQPRFLVKLYPFRSTEAKRGQQFLSPSPPTEKAEITGNHFNGNGGDGVDSWCEKVLFPYIDKTRTKLGYPGAAVVLLDGRTYPVTDYFFDECTLSGVVPIFLPPHSSDQTQSLHLAVFRIEKAKASKMRPASGLNPQSKQIIKTVNGYHREC